MYAYLVSRKLASDLEVTEAIDKWSYHRYLHCKVVKPFPTAYEIMLQMYLSFPFYIPNHL